MDSFSCGKQQDPAGAEDLQKHRVRGGPPVQWGWGPGSPEALAVAHSCSSCRVRGPHLTSLPSVPWRAETRVPSSRTPPDWRRKAPRPQRLGEGSSAHLEKRTAHCANSARRPGRTVPPAPGRPQAGACDSRLTVTCDTWEQKPHLLYLSVTFLLKTGRRHCPSSVSVS